MYSRSTGEVNSNRITSSLLENEPDFRPMHTKFERLLSKSLTTLEVMTYDLVMHTGPGSDKCTYCHTEVHAADQTCHLNQSQYTDTGPAGPRADPIALGARRLAG